MTPGFAKTRQELPWLYYPEADSVIINAHNFGGGGAFSPAVNGKMPIAAWIPSLDNAGNGTTTLTDLVGSNNGTLTNMDAATDWVADTDSGGVRALDFDGVNDYVSIPHAAGLLFPSVMSISLWVRKDAATNVNPLGKQQPGANDGNYALISQSTNNIIFGFFSSATGAQRWVSASPVFTTGVWHQLAISVSWSASVAAAIGVYIDGAAVSGAWTGTGIGLPIQNTNELALAAVSGGAFNRMTGRLDDIRIWDQALDATDIADLATGRGVDVA